MGQFISRKRRNRLARVDRAIELTAQSLECRSLNRSATIVLVADDNRCVAAFSISVGEGAEGLVLERGRHPSLGEFSHPPAHDQTSSFIRRRLDLIYKASARRNQSSFRVFVARHGRSGIFVGTRRGFRLGRLIALWNPAMAPTMLERPG